MWNHFRKLIGLRGLTPGEYGALNAKNIRVITVVSIVLIVAAGFLLYSQLQDPSFNPTMGYAQNGSVEAGAGIPKEDHSGDTGAHTINPTAGTGSFLGLLAVNLGLNGIDNHISMLVVILSVGVFELLMLLCCILKYTILKKNENFALVFIHLIPIFWGAFSLSVFYYNHAGNLLVFILINAVVPWIVVINPFFEMVLMAICGVGYAYISSLYNAFNLSVAVNLVSFWIITTGIAIWYYSNKLAEARTTLRVHSMSTHDELTGIKNRYALKLDTESYIGHSVVLAMQDLDDFKYYNDAFGHEFGDEVLRQFSDLLKELFDKEYLYRYGGDEFLILGVDVDVAKFTQRLEECRERIKKISVGEQTDLYLTSSCGFCYGRLENLENIRAMTALADQKLYEAKRLGKDRAIGVPYTPTEGELERLADWDRMYKSNDLDILTKLPNKLHFYNRAAKIVARAEDAGDLAIVYLNIENFYLYNMQYGFSEGDTLLVTLAEKIREVFKGDLITHLEGDRFAILTQRDKLLSRVREINGFGHDMGRGTHLEIKSGISFIQNSEDIALCCDRAMLACESIKGQYDRDYRFYDNSLENRIHAQQYFWENLDQVIAAERLVVFYQPIIRTMTGEVCEMEALVRWKDSDLGFIPPDQFIRVLEDSHLIHKVDMYVIEHVCKDIVRARAEGRPMIPVSINLSRMDFKLCDILGFIDDTATVYGVPKHMLKFELTESVLVDRGDELRSHIQRIQNYGYDVWMDDFGSGFSSLNVLKDYNFNLIKVDMEFLRNFGISKRSRIMIETIIHLTKQLGMQSLVEGVETKEQFDFLRSIGCEKVQGYYFAHPMPYDDVSGLIGSELQAEPSELQPYYDDLGMISLAGRGFDFHRHNEFNSLVMDHPMILCELMPDTKELHPLEANGAFMNLMHYFKVPGLDDLCSRMNDSEDAYYTIIREKIEETIKEGTLYFELKCQKVSLEICMRCTARRSDRVALFVVFMPLERE